METVVNAIRSVVGDFDFYIQNPTTNEFYWDYGLLIEYVCGVIIVCICVSAIFKFITKLID